MLMLSLSHVRHTLTRRLVVVNMFMLFFSHVRRALAQRLVVVRGEKNYFLVICNMLLVYHVSGAYNMLLVYYSISFEHFISVSVS